MLSIASFFADPFHSLSSPGDSLEMNVAMISKSPDSPQVAGEQPGK